MSTILNAQACNQLDKEFWDKRRIHIQEKSYISALSLEEEFLPILRNEDRFIIAHAWTLNALKHHNDCLTFLLNSAKENPGRPAILEKIIHQMRLLNCTGNIDPIEQQLVLARQVERLRFKQRDLEGKGRMIGHLTDLANKSLAASKWRTPENQQHKNSIADTILKFNWDNEPDWILNSPDPKPQNQLVDLSPLGRFHTGNPSEVIFKRINRSIPWELHITALLRELALQLSPTSTIVDIGTNIGANAIPMALAFNGIVWGFEPVPETFNALQRNVVLSGTQNLEIFNHALSDSEGTGAMFDVSPSNPGVAKLDKTTQGATKFVTLDSITSQRAASVSLVKIDVEGHEELVFKGAKNTIIKDRPIVIAEAFPKSGLFTFLSSFGYRHLNIQGHDWIFIPPPA